MRAGNLGVPTASEWLNDVLAPGCRVGIDPVTYALLPLFYLVFTFSYPAHNIMQTSNTALLC